MDGQRYHSSGGGGGLGTHNTTPPLDWPPNSSLDSSSRPMERTSSTNLRTTFRTTVGSHNTIRAVTPDMPERDGGTSTSTSNQDPGPSSSHVARGFGSTSPQSSPRSIPRPGDVARRQGVVFHESFGASYDSSSSSPPARQTSGSFRPRTHTMDGALRQHVAVESRHRVGSFSSAGSQPLFDDNRAPPPLPARPSDVSTGSMRDKKSSTRRLVKRQSSRPTSPQPSTPSVDSLPIPIPTEDANKVLLLMKTLCGRMRGEVEYQVDAAGPWTKGIAYVDEERGSLMFDSGLNGPFHTALVVDLRGCRVSPLNLTDPEKRCLEIVSALPAQAQVELLLHPLVTEEGDLWLAALLCWQQLRPPKVKLSNGNRSTTPTTVVRPPLRTRSSDNAAPKASTNLIKVGQVRLWDKGLANSPRAIVKRPSTRDLRSVATSWRLVSCLLQENGEMRLTTTDGDSIIAVVELSQLSRCAIQHLDKSVLDDEHCIAIFPHYSALSTQLSIFRPVYIALENRLLFEVWFVLLRAFALPDIYRLGPPESGLVSEILDLETDVAGEVFRVEKTLTVRVTEAKLRPKLGSTDTSSFVERNERPSKNEADPLMGNYFAELILDGEVRARTPIKTGTKNPYWREEYVYYDLPPTMPFLSVILKRVDGNLDIFHPQLQASTNVSKFSNLSETLCGSVDISLDQVERGKDSDRWLEIHDEHQQVLGTMLVKVHHEELIVLHSKEYMELSTLLHSFPSGLTAQIASALPGQLRKLSEIFLNIFQVSGQANEWLQTLVEDEIDGVGSQSQMKKFRFGNRLKSNESLESTSDREHFVRETGRSLAGEANLLFRGNTLLTQALEFHLRRAGKEYLELMLAAKVNEIKELNPNCEVDPSKMKPGENLQQNWDRLLQMATEIWQCISKDPTKCPPELRSILKYVRAVAEDRYGDWLRTVKYTSVSSFLFLRFICPAILSPKLFGLLPDHPRPRAQRTFTLIAKALQALGNLTTFGKKEDWMEPMNKFLTAQRTSIRDYIDAICAIPVERNKVALGPSYSTPMQIHARLSPNAREGFPALPHLIDHARNFAALVKLWTQVNPLANTEHALSSVDGGDDILIFNEMCIALQQRTDTCHAKFESSRVPDSASPSVSDLAEVLDHSTLLDTSHVSFGTPGMTVSSPETYSSPHFDSVQPPGSAGSDLTQEPGSSSRRSREQRRGREVSQSMRHVSGQSEMSSSGNGGTLKRHNNGRRNILSGIMKPFGRSDSPEGSSSLSRTGKSLERAWNQGA